MSTSMVPSLLDENYGAQLEILYEWNWKIASIPDVNRERKKHYNRLGDRY
jgi:hypothetical protein